MYTGSKPQYPNYGLFAVDAKSTPTLAPLQGLGGEQGLLVPLAADGLEHAATGIRGWRQKADVGIHALGHGLFYLATDGDQGGNETATLRLEAWTGNANDPFAPVTPDYRTGTLVGTSVGGYVASTLSLTLDGAASFGAFAPGIERDYTAGMGRPSRPRPATRR